MPDGTGRFPDVNLNSDTWFRRAAHLSVIALMFLALAACKVDAKEEMRLMTPGQIDCVAAKGVDPGRATALCRAVQDRHPQGGLRLHVLAAGPTFLSARLDGVTGRQGRALDLSVMDRDLGPSDYEDLARDLLRFGLPD